MRKIIGNQMGQADGYTLLMANTGTMVINPFVYTKNAYVTLRDFTPIARTAQQPLALVVNWRPMT